MAQTAVVLEDRRENVRIQRGGERRQPRASRSEVDQGRVPLVVRLE
eukprot:CAMPEP_0202821644 /NCGR_PEP_ID=MMETSP1389-20130828/10514_1 /ASSEMBLY_ACC=CAM_ASM_000865 /TAXON_ID=302021 /ORGANISM="Rhodomonas sp., Strain CCMP768" /LENGTH=45 /DNA_ID= /DNA_START= /DNA_END= /DNA_ORIENTATION=